jgi:membrane-bound serine protease (ClpP class)
MRRLIGLSIGMLATAGTLVAQDPLVYRIPINGTIENGLAPYVARSLSDAQAAGARLVVLDIDTPGGRIDAAERIVDAVRRAPMQVVAYINPRAWSAGAMVALAADQIWVAPGSALGAATPVDGSGTKASEKMVSAMRAEFRSLAEAGGRNPAIAEAMVDEALGAEGLATPGQLLSLTANQALEVGFAEGQAATLDDLLVELGLGGAQVRTLDATWAENVVRFLTNPLVAPMLLSLGMLGLIFEIKAGAFGLGGLLSLASLGLFFGSSFLLGLAGWEEIILLGVGLIALGVEAFVLPGFGVAGILGIAAVGGAMVMALLGSTPTGGDITMALAVLGTALVITAAVFFTWLRRLPNSERWEGLLLRGSVHRNEGYLSAPARDELIGKVGVALTDLRPSGTALVADERIDVVSEGEWVKAGAEVIVVRSEGYKHVVRPAPVSTTPNQGA